MYVMDYCGRYEVIKSSQYLQLEQDKLCFKIAVPDVKNVQPLKKNGTSAYLKQLKIILF